MEFYTRGDSACGSVRVLPPDGWPSRSGGRPPRKDGWSVGGTVYRSWADAWRGAIAPIGAVGRTAPSAASYFRAWSVPDGVAELEDLLRDPTPVVHAPPTFVASVGIDLSRRGIEVRKLLYAGFGLRMARAGYDPEEVLQEVYRGILVRNRGKCPFDARKSSFGHYVHMVIECILSNYHRRESRRRDAEGSWEDLPEGRRERAAEGVGDAGASDVVGWGVESSPSGGGDMMALRMMADAVRCFPGLTEREEELALGVLPLLSAGHAPTPRGAREAGWSWADWRDGVSVLRRVASAQSSV